MDTNININITPEPLISVKLEKVMIFSPGGSSEGQGQIGPAGPKGDTGIQGLQGIQGNIGPRGEKGDQGLKGDTGTNGYTPIKGVDYFDGIQGIKGDTGLQGLKGDTGNTGAKGDTGLQGIQGIQGVKGDMGSAGTTNYNDLNNKPDLSNLHSPFLLGSKTLDEATIADGKVIAYDNISGHLKYVTPASSSTTLDFVDINSVTDVVLVANTMTKQTYAVGDVIRNIGSHWDTTTNKYVVPRSGLYQIRVALESKLSPIWLESNVYLNGVKSGFQAYHAGLSNGGAVIIENPCPFGIKTMFLNTGDVIEIYNRSPIGSGCWRRQLTIQELRT